MNKAMENAKRIAGRKYDLSKVKLDGRPLDPPSPEPTPDQKWTRCPSCRSIDRNKREDMIDLRRSIQLPCPDSWHDAVPSAPVS